jgi:hypothetical protein
MSNTGQKPVVPYWHVWTDDRGVSRQSRAALTDFDLQSMSGAASQWQDRFCTTGATVLITVLPPGWQGDWHENPRPQWIIPLSGTWQVDTMDGQTVTMGPGDISFGEDQNCRPNARGQKGHLSRVIGDQPCVQMVVQLHITPTIGQPGRFT